MPVRRFVITSAQNATPPKQEFLASLKKYCSHNNAQLIVIPYRYHNPTSMWTENDKSRDWWHKDLEKYLLVTRTEISPGLVVMADVRTQPTAVRPLSGMEAMTGGKSCILPHPKLELVTVPTPQNRLAKIMCTTGAVTEKNYTESKAGKKGDFHHSFAAVVVEVLDNGAFFIRQLNSKRDGSFCDLNKEYTPRRVLRASPDALVMGDTHVRFMDPEAREALFGESGMITQMKPKILVWHDVQDSYSVSPHHRKPGQFFVQLAKFKGNYANAEDELLRTFRFIDKNTPRGVTNVFPYSNHPDMLSRWVAQVDPKTDPANCVFWAKTFQFMAEGTEMRENGEYTPDPFKYWANRWLLCYKRCHFLGVNDSYQINDIEVGMHGHLGPNGSRGNLRSTAKIGVKTVTAHTHAPAIIEGAYQVGTSSFLRLAFMKGPSSHAHCHCWIYRNGKRSLQFSVGTDWRL
jgi:hypothetical protein